MIRFAIVLLACLPTIILAQTHASRCGHHVPGAFNVNVAGCIYQPCKVVAGGTADTQLWFFARRLITKITPKVTLTLADGTQVPYPIPAPDLDGCKTLKLGKCPLWPWELAIYDIPVRVDPNIPPTSINAQLELFDQDGQIIICNDVDITVTSNK